MHKTRAVSGFRLNLGRWRKVMRFTQINKEVDLSGRDSGQNKSSCDILNVNLSLCSY